MLLFFSHTESVYATLPKTQRGLPLVLGGDPKGKTFLYPNGNSIVIRDIENPSLSDIYTEHSAQTTVAKYSPSGYYICSADTSGKVRIWDTTQKEHILKNEFQPFAGTVKDLSWSPDNQRIVAVGEGREKFGHVFMMETGTSVGEIAGHSKIINSCDFKPSRPFRIITGSEDNFIGIYEGPPFKFKHQLEDHNRFVQTVRFSPSGELFASGGFDGKIFLYKSTDYSKTGEFGSPAHAGGVYAISWSPDGTKLLSASGDKTCKIWNVETLQLVTEFPMGSDLLDQQVSCLWQGKHLLSVSLSGFINYLDVNNPSKPLRIVKGHNKPITALTINKTADTLFTAGNDGSVTRWNALTGENDRLNVTHTNQIADVVTDDSFLYSCGLDDVIRITALESNDCVNSVKTDSQPRSLSLIKDRKILLVACFADISVISCTGDKLSLVAVKFEPNCIDTHPNGSECAVGGDKDSSVHIFSLDQSNNLTPKTQLQHREAVTDVAYSPDGTYLAACDSNRKVVLYLSSNYEVSVRSVPHVCIVCCSNISLSSHLSSLSPTLLCVTDCVTLFTDALICLSLSLSLNR